jgi:hypothetical protein
MTALKRALCALQVALVAACGLNDKMQMLFEFQQLVVLFGYEIRPSVWSRMHHRAETDW